MADLVIIGAVLFGALAGWRKGFVLPLIALGGALLSIAALYAGPLNGIVPSGTAGLGLGAAALFLGGAVLGRVGGVLVGLVYRFQMLRRIDKVVGIPLGAVTATVAVYVAPSSARSLWMAGSRHSTGRRPSMCRTCRRYRRSRPRIRRSGSSPTRPCFRRWPQPRRAPRSPRTSSRSSMRRSRSTSRPCDPSSFRAASSRCC